MVATASVMLSLGLSVSLVNCNMCLQIQDVEIINALRPLQLGMVSGKQLPILENITVLIKCGELELLH